MWFRGVTQAAYRISILIIKNQNWKIMEPVLDGDSTIFGELSLIGVAHPTRYNICMRLGSIRGYIPKLTTKLPPYESSFCKPCVTY